MNPLLPATDNQEAWILRAPAALDLPALHALDQSCFPPDIAYSRAELKHFLWHPSSFSIVAWEDAVILGFGVARVGRRRSILLERIAPTLHIITIDVSPQHRRRGVGRGLMAWFHQQAARTGAQAIALEVAVDNHEAQRFYAASGFQVTGVIPGYYNSILDAYTLERLAAFSAAAVP